MGRVLNADTVKQKLTGSPAVYREEILSWLLNENTSFIGSKTKTGLIRQRLYDKRRWSDSGTWRKQVVNLVNGKIIDPLTGQVVTRKGLVSAKGTGGGLFNQGISMNLKMGVMYRNQKQIHKAMEFLEEGGTISSDKYMPVPVHGSNMVKAFEKFRYWLKNNMFTVIYKNGVALYFLNNKRGGVLEGEKMKGKLMFVGKKSININFKIGLRNAFEARKGAMISRGELAVDKGTKRLNDV